MSIKSNYVNDQIFSFVYVLVISVSSYVFPAITVVLYFLSSFSFCRYNCFVSLLENSSFHQSVGL